MNNFLPKENNIQLIDNLKTVNFQSAPIGLDEGLTQEEIQNINNNVFYMKLASILIVTGISLLFGIMPYVW